MRELSPRRPFTLALCLALTAAVAVYADRGSAATAARSDDRAVTIRATALAVDESNRDAGELQLVAAFQLTADDADFGGFSGLALRDDGAALTAISDRGHWLTAELHHRADGTLDGIGAGRLGPLLGLDGTPLRGQRARDAEELEASGDGWLVSFEGEHRLWHYPAAGSPAPSSRPTPVPTPDILARAGSNSGLEAMARLADGRLLVLTEDFRNDDKTIIGWIGAIDGSAWGNVAVHPSFAFKPTGAAALADGGVILLQRLYDPRIGVHARLSLITAADLTAHLAGGAPITDHELARLGPEHHVDNMEAIAVRAAKNGDRLVYLLSDDNFNHLQRTVLLQLRWPAKRDQP